MKFRKRKTDSVPASVTAAGGNADAAKAYAGVAELINVKLHQWFGYYRTLSGKENANMSEIFRQDDINDYDEEVNTDTWLEKSSNAYRF